MQTNTTYNSDLCVSHLLWCKSLQQFDWCQQQTSSDLFLTLLPTPCSPLITWAPCKRITSLASGAPIALHPIPNKSVDFIVYRQAVKHCTCTNVVKHFLVTETVHNWIHLKGADNSKIVKCVIIAGWGYWWLPTGVSCKDTAHKWPHAGAAPHGNTWRCGSVASARLFSCATHSASQSANHQISPGPDRLRVWPVYDQHVCSFAV